MAPVRRLKPYAGPALFSYGFRPYFLAGAIFGALAIALWLPQYEGVFAPPGALAPVAWHAHEMLFGFAPAIITGFLLTAVPNWTGRLPLQGRPLIALLLAWFAGRIAVAASAWLGWAATMALDCAYLLILAAVVGREIVAGKNWRNLKVLAILSLMLLCNVAFHLEAHLTGVASYAQRGAIAATLLLVILIGGRVTPSFTRNWLVRENPGPLPTAGGRLDNFFVTSAALAATAWVAFPQGGWTGALLAVAGCAQVVRLSRWLGWRARRDVLVLVLHVFYAFIPVGYFLAALAAWRPDLVASSAGVHAWTVGAVGGMILAVMTRASLGHTGRALRASPATIGIYIALGVAAAARIVAAQSPAWSLPLLHLAAGAWIIAFAGFAIVYGPLLARPRSP